MVVEHEIPNGSVIESYMHCGLCLDEKPDGISPQNYAQLEVGFTILGIQVWCKRHQANVCHIDFEGQQHPANTGREAP